MTHSCLLLHTHARWARLFRNSEGFPLPHLTFPKLKNPVSPVFCRVHARNTHLSRASNSFNMADPQVALPTLLNLPISPYGVKVTRYVCVVCLNPRSFLRRRPSRRRVGGVGNQRLTAPL